MEVSTLFDSNGSDEQQEYGLDDRFAPSLPIILIGAAAGVAGGVTGLYLAYVQFGLNAAASAAVATLGLCAGLGITGAAFSSLTGSRATLSNIGFGCGLIVLVLLFFGFCSLVGALAATLILTLGA